MPRLADERRIGVRYSSAIVRERALIARARGVHDVPNCRLEHGGSVTRVVAPAGRLQTDSADRRVPELE